MDLYNYVKTNVLNKKAVVLALLFLSFNAASQNRLQPQKEKLTSEIAALVSVKAKIAEIIFDKKAVSSFNKNCTGKLITKRDASKSRYDSGTVNLSCSSNNAEISLRYKIKGTVPVLVTRNRILRHQLIDKTNTTLEFEDMSTVRRSNIFSFKDINDVRAKRDLEKGKFLNFGDIYSPPTIMRNSNVRIIVHNDKFYLEEQGKALDDGYINDVINVVNNQSLTIIRAKVLNSFSVEVL